MAYAWKREKNPRIPLMPDDMIVLFLMKMAFNQIWKIQFDALIKFFEFGYFHGNV